jgi:hypothetical protein
MKVEKAFHQGRLFIRDAIQNKLNFLMLRVRENLSDEIWSTDTEREKCTLSVMRLAYDVFDREPVSKDDLHLYKMTQRQLNDVVGVMQAQLSKYDLTMASFQSLNELGYDIASSVHSRIKDFDVIRSKLYDLQMLDSQRAELLQTLAEAEKIHD